MKAMQQLQVEFKNTPGNTPLVPYSVNLLAKQKSNGLSAIDTSWLVTAPKRIYQFGSSGAKLESIYHKNYQFFSQEVRNSSSA